MASFLYLLFNWVFIFDRIPNWNFNMKKVTKELLKEIANGLKFDMSEEEYDKLLADFDILTKQFALLDDEQVEADK